MTPFLQRQPAQPAQSSEPGLPVVQPPARKPAADVRGPRFVARWLRHPLLASVAARTTAGRVTRRLLMVVVALPLLGTLGEMMAAQWGFSARWTGGALVALQLVLFPTVVLYTGMRLYRSEQLRDRAERERAQTQRQIERQAAILQNEVARRTSELSRALAYNRRLALVAAHTNDAVVLTDPAGGIEWVNEGFTRLTGYTPEEAAGRNVATLLVGPLSASGTIAQICERMGTGQGINTEILHHAKDGRPFWSEIEVQPYRDAAGQLAGFIGKATDITERKNAEERLRAAKEEAEQLNTQLENAIAQAQQSAIEANLASQAKSAFLATMSHEIRTPLNGIIGMAGLLRDTGLDARQLDFVRTIETSGDALLTILNDVLDYSKIEAGRIELESSPFDLRQCVEDALDLFAAKAAEKNLELLSHLAPGVPAAIVGDITRFRQVLVNLVGNALKFTARGEVEVTLTAAPAPDGRHEIHCAVRDTGIGIPEDRRDRLFQPFSQVDSSTTRKFGGTGLGLAISRRLAEAMGGRMWVESEVGRGSLFHFTIVVPEEPVTVLPRWQATPSPLAGRTALVVEDNDAAREWLARRLQAWGLQVAVVASAAAAMDWLRADHRCDVALLDRHLPGADGLALATEVRKISAREKLPLLLLSPLAERAQTAGFLALVSKPLKPAQLFDAMLRALEVERGGNRAAAGTSVAAGDAPGTSLPISALRLLLVEDNAVNQRVATMLLAKLGYQVRLAENGAQALSALAEQAYDVILMDMEMPVMDGCEATRRIRETAEAARPWIVALTANAMNSDRQRALAAGMNDFVTKPIRLTDLSAALGRAKSGLSVAAAA
jgi:PAS domain S-box-containing protein